MRIICDRCSEDDMVQITIIDDDSDEFKDINRDEVLVSIIFLVKEGTLLDFCRKSDVPPEA